MSESLYDITSEFKYLYDLYANGDIEEDVFNDNLAGIQFEDRLEEKIDGYSVIDRQLTGNIETVKAEIDRLQKVKKHFENRRDEHRARLFQAMKTLGRDKISTPLNTFAIQANPKSLHVIDETLIPTEYYNVVYTLDKNKAKDAIKAGTVVPGCELAQTESLRIK